MDELYTGGGGRGKAMTRTERRERQRHPENSDRPPRGLALLALVPYPGLHPPFDGRKWADAELETAATPEPQM